MGLGVTSPDRLFALPATAVRQAAGLGGFAAGAGLRATRAATRLGTETTRAAARLGTETTRVGARAVTRAAPQPMRRVQTAVHRGTATATNLPREARWAARALTDLNPVRQRRRVHAGDGRADIEVRGLEGRGARTRRLGSGVAKAVRRLEGVRWAEVNAVTGQVLVAFDERRVDVETLLDTVRKVESAHGTREEAFEWSRPTHPSDSTPVAAAATELAADCVGLAAAMAERVLRIPPLPRALRLAVAIIEVEPGLKRQLKRQVGPIETDVVLTLASAALHGLTGGIGAPAVDALYRLELFAEAQSRRAVWLRREAELCEAGPMPREAPAPPPRPRPRPEGPIEEWTRRLGPTAPAAAAAVLALTRDPARASDMILAAVPKAARVGREGYAATVARALARSGTVPLNAGVFRRLDRVSAIVLDSPSLCTRRAQIITAEAGPDVPVSDVWRVASKVLHELSMDDLYGAGPWARDGHRLAPADDESHEPAGDDPERTAARALRLAVYDDDRLLGHVTVGGELDPLADAVMDAARSTGARVLLTHDPSVTELLPRADAVLDQDRSLTEHVRALQEEDNAVLLVSGTADEALAAADVGIGVVSPDSPVCWSADLLCGPGLADVWRLILATGQARGASEQAVRMAEAGSAISGLLALVGDRRRGLHRALAPVHAAALVALLQGTVSGLRVTRQPLPPPVAHVPWHAFDAEDVLERLDQARGRTAEEAAPTWVDAVVARARASAGSVTEAPVLAPVRATASLAGAVREELRDPLTPVLAVGATASAIVGSGVDAVLVGGVMIGNALISGVQRLATENTLRELLLEQEVSARRLERRPEGRLDGKSLADVPIEKVSAKDLEPGDIIALEASDVIPADGRLLHEADLEVDESALTGESTPVAKDVASTPGAPVAERTCMVFDGTAVLAGTAYAVVVATGEATQAGRATRLAGRAQPPAGIQARLHEVTRTALPATAIGGAAVTGLALLRRTPLREAVAAGVAIAVAAVPEGLPLVATVAQASAARRLSRSNTLVRSPRTLEALGRVDTVCFDKTGTLTEGKLALARISSTTGEVEDGSPEARRVLAAAARACPPVGEDDVHGVPHATDRAILAAGREAADSDGWQLRVELPFESSRGLSASLGSTEEGNVLAVKGAPEQVLARCGRVLEEDADTEFTDDRRRAAEQLTKTLAADGLRVLAVAERRDVPEQHDDVEQLVSDLTLLGFVGIADTPRPDAADAIRDLAGEGVRIVMITGDHPETASAIARAVGISDASVVTGDDLERMTESQRIERVREATVFARVSPEHKLQIVDALQRGGHVVAMTGDGINDAAAIRLADVGIGVAGRATTSARSAADLVLADSDVRRVHEALLEGRALWRRVQDAVSILVGGNAGEVAFMVLGTALSGRAPINTRQLLLVNMLTDMFPALAVAVASRSGGGLPTGDGPQSTRAALGAPLARAVAIRGTATALGATTAWTLGRFTGRRQRAGSMGLAALVTTQLGQTLLTGRHSPLVVATSLASFGVLFVVVETPGVSHFFGCTPLGPLAWTIVLGSAAAGTAAAAVAPRWLPVEPADEPADEPTA